MIVLNKCSDAGPDRVDAARKIIRALNRAARIIETDHSRVAPGDILNTGLFDFERAHEHPKRTIEPCGFADPTPETEEYDVTSFVYLDRCPSSRARSTNC